MTNSRMLTFEVVSEGDEIEIHADKQGMKDLIYYLKRMLDSKSKLPNHDHLMSNSWGGGELTDDKQGEDNILINKVTIRLWPVIEDNKNI